MACRSSLVLLDFTFDGQFNVLELAVTDCIEKAKGRLDAGSYWKQLGGLNHAQGKNRDRSSRNRTNCVARSTDFACSHPNCTYHHELESKIVLHARSHFAFEVSPDATSGSILRFDGDCGKYTCSKCPRATSDKICFREHLRHHLFAQPYVCPVCSQQLQSIAGVRLHFQNEHPKQPSDLAFTYLDECDVVDEIAQLLHPCAKPLERPLELFVVDESRNQNAGISNVFPVNRVSRSSSASSNNPGVVQTATQSTKNYGAGKVHDKRNFTNRLRLSGKQYISQRLDKFRMQPSTFSFSGNAYCCHTCAYRTEAAATMRVHAWKHIHGAWGSDCQHHSSNKSLGCAILNGLTEILSKVTVKKPSSEQAWLSTNYANSSVHSGDKLQKNELHRSSQVGDTGNQQPLPVPQSVSSTSDRQKATSAMQLSNRGNSPARPAVRKFESMSSRQNLPVSDKSSAVDSGMFTLHHDQIPLPVKCRRCSFTCNINAQLELHNRTCNGVRKRKPGRFNCMHCNMTTDRKNILLWHVAHHEGEHEVCYHMCSGCQFATMLDEEMTAHELERHAGSKALSISVTEKVTYLQNILKCPLCSYGLMWGSIYFGHLRKEHHLSGLAEYLEKTYSDSSCPRTIQFPKHLLNADAGGDSAAGSSIVSRVDNAPVEICKFHCEYCEFSTNDNVGYLDHQKSHVIRCDKISDVSNRCAGEKNDYVTKYFCPSCAFTSVVEEQFRLHMDDHVKYDQLDDGFMCGICAYKCPSHSRVREHMKSFHLNIPDGKIVKIGSNGKKSDSSNKKKVGGGKTKNNARPKSAKGKQACSDVRSTAYEKDSNGSAYSRSSRNSSCSTSQLSQKQNIRDVIDTFERELPSVQVFARDMKCPVCDFTNRFRVNVMRHLKMHREHARRPSQTTEPLVESRLSFGLWKPLNNDQSVNCSGARDSGRLDRANDALMNSGMTTGINDLEAGQPHLRQELMEHAVPRSAAAAEMDSDKKIRHPSSSGVQYFRCEVCEDRFNTKANLERHITERHQGPYVCHLCGQLMWQKGSVRKHYTADHPGAPVMYEVIRREIGDDSGTEQSQAAVEKKVARIQGVLRSGDVLGESDLLDSSNTRLSTDHERRPLSSQRYDVHSADLQLPSSASGAVPTSTGASIPQPQAFGDCRIMNEPKVSSLPSVDFSISAPLATTSHSNVSSLPISGLAGTLGSSTCVGGTLNTTADATAVSNLQWCMPPTTVSTCEPAINSAVRSFDAIMSAYSAGQVAAGTPQFNSLITDLLRQIPQLQQIPQSAWSANHPSNLLSAFGNINIENMKTMLAAHLVPVLANMMANPALLPGLMNILGQTVLPNNGFNQHLAAIMSQFAATVAQSAKPAVHNGAKFEPPSNLHGQVTVVGVSASEVSMPSTCTTSSASLESASCSPSVFTSVSMTHSAVVAPSSSSQSVTTSVSSCSTISSNARMCNLIPLARSDEQTSLAPRSGSPTPSLSSVGTTISDSESFEFSGDDSDKRGRPKRKRRRIERFAPRSSSIASSVSSVRSGKSITRHKKRKKSYSAARYADGTVLACNRCSYSTRSRSDYSRHIGLELSISGSFSQQHSVDEQVLRRCTYCSFSTFLSDEFDEHLRTHVTTKRYRCIYCTFAGFSSKDVRRHMDRHHPGRPFAINREPRPARLTGIRNVNFDPVVLAVDVLKLSHRQVRRLMTENDVGAIDFCC